jgi:hypothetical protein
VPASVVGEYRAAAMTQTRNAKSTRKLMISVSVFDLNVANRNCGERGKELEIGDTAMTSSILRLSFAGAAQ